MYVVCAKAQRAKAVGDGVQGKGCPLSLGKKFFYFLTSLNTFSDHLCYCSNSNHKKNFIKGKLKVRIRNINNIHGMCQDPKGQGCGGWGSKGRGVLTPFVSNC